MTLSSQFITSSKSLEGVIATKGKFSSGEEYVIFKSDSGDYLGQLNGSYAVKHAEEIMEVIGSSLRYFKLFKEKA